MQTPPPALARHERAGRLVPARLAIRYGTRVPPERSEEGVIGPLERTEGPLRAGSQVLGPFGVRLALDAAEDVVRLDVAVHSRAEAPLHLESVCLGLRWEGPPAGGLRFLRHGWQSWSETGGRRLESRGDPPFPSGPWLRGLHHALPAPPPERSGWHESALVTVSEGGGGACLAGVLERGRGTGLVYLRREGEALWVEVEVFYELPLEPGETLEVERVHLALGTDAGRLLEDYAEALGATAGARTRSAFQTGWCSWYHFFHRVTEADLLRNLEALTKARREIPVEVVQLDDGWQRAVGDWLETNEKFPRGIAPLAQEIRAAGFRPGLWTAPFCVAPESRLFAAHPEWLLRRGEGHHRALLHPEWSPGGWIHALDPSRPEVATHLLRTYAALAGMGFRYLKLDFLYAVAMQADAHDPRVTRAGRLRRGLEAIRAGAGEEAFLLGCGCPLGAAVGLVDGMRIGPDVAPHWAPDPSFAVPGLEATAPSTRNAVRNVLARSWMHRRLWINDPDCLMTRSHHTALEPVERRTLAAAIAASGGPVIFSDDVPDLAQEGRELLRSSIELAREVDAAGGRGVSRAFGLLDPEMPAGLVARGPASALVLAINGGEEAREVRLDLDCLVPSRGGLPPQPLLGSRDPEPRELDVARSTLAPHESWLLRIGTDPPLAVFCDYDGTFVRQDVGASLARLHAGERRPELWERLRAGRLTPWQYNLELLDGLALPEERVEAFLRTVELDPGARALVAWCEERGVPFRILSDGFDRNLDRLQELHGVRFRYDANHLWYEDDVWRIAAGHPDDTCSCGTGVCKRGRIARFRAAHPGVRVVHVGNGRVSDLCAARAADVVFAKDTLAEELTAQGVAFEPFETLHDVIRGLERLWHRQQARGREAR